MRRLRALFARILPGRFQPRFAVNQDPGAMRRPTVESDRILMPATIKWLELLPEYARPRLFCERFPRIVNQLAAVWGERKLCKLYFDVLMGDDRGGRVGFAPDVRKELVRLRVFYETSMTDAGAELDWKQRMAASQADRAMSLPRS